MKTKLVSILVALISGAALGVESNYVPMAVNTNNGIMAQSVAALKLTNGATISAGKIDTTNILVYTLQGTNYYTPLQLLTP